MQKNKWVELNGNSFTREIYTEEEFMEQYLGMTP